MAIPHAAPGEIVQIRDSDRNKQSETLVRTHHLEVFRYVLASGKTIAEHAAAGLMIIQCIEGRIEFTALGRTQVLSAGCMLYLDDGEPHALKALENSSLLVTLLLRRA